MYTKKIWIFRHYIEIEKGYSGRRGNHKSHKGRTNPTPEQMKVYNQNQAARKLNRKICANFGLGDYHIVLTYKPENRLPPDEAKKALKRFLNNLRKDYRKAGSELKYIITTEWRYTAIHHHIIINRIRGTTEMVRRRWTSGRPRFTPLDDTGDYIKLAEYFVKETSKKKIEGKEKGRQSYSCSRNLIIPQPKIKRIHAKDFVDEPKPIKGYYIVKDSLVNGVTPFGRKYQYYKMAKLPGTLVKSNVPGKRRKNE